MSPFPPAGRYAILGAKKCTRRVPTMAAKKNEKKKIGHRQPYTKVQIVKIEG